MCKKLDKDVKLKIIGEETEVDKNIIEHISDPLMHLVRNSIDHGIESPENKLYDLTEYGGYLFMGHSESLNREMTRYKYIMPAVYRKE